MGSPKHRDTVEGGQKGEGDRLQGIEVKLDPGVICSHLEVTILPGEEGDAPVDGETQKVGRHTPVTNKLVEVTS